MNEYEHLLQLILDVGVEMIRCGAETHRVEDCLYRLCSSYGFRRCNIWVIPSNIQASVLTPNENCLTQVRHIRGCGIDFSRLDALNTLSRHACAEHLSSSDFADRLSKITEETSQKKWGFYLGGVLAGGGFGIFFNCDLADALAAALISLLVAFLIRKIEKVETNPLMVNFVISLLSESLIIFSVRHGLGHHVGYVAAGVVMLLISALGTTNGIRDLMRLDTLSGVMNISASLTGAIGIALGIVLPLRLFLQDSSNEIMILNPSIKLELVACTIGCVGFSLWFHVKPKHIPWCALGAFITWSVYSLCTIFSFGTFGAALAGAIVCAFYAQIMARTNKAPATIFQTVAIFPMIPGAALYYFVYGLVIGNLSFALEKGLALLLSCFGIVLGFLLIQVLSHFLWPISNMNH